MRESLLPILEDFGVDLVLTGHSHSYERSFLIDGHYGTSGTLVPSMILDSGDGRPTGTGAYEKASIRSRPASRDRLYGRGELRKAQLGWVDGPSGHVQFSQRVGLVDSGRRR